MTADVARVLNAELLELERAHAKRIVYIVDYDLPANNSRRRFYRRIQRYLKAHVTGETTGWSTQSVVITTDREFAEFVYQEASHVGQAHLYRGEKLH